MGRPPDCSSRCVDCLCCRTLTLHQWTGDLDFAAGLDITGYAGYDPKILTQQRSDASLLWRIRYDPDEDFIQYLTDTRTLVAGSVLDGTAFINYMPFSNAVAILSGPVRDGIICGLDMVPAGRYIANTYRRPTFTLPDPYTAAVDRAFIGTANLKSYNTNGSPSPSNWTIQDHPDNPIAIPWALEIGCNRCQDQASVSWPDHENWHYDPLDYAGETSAVDADNSTLTSTTVSGSCQAITPDDLESIYWPGDEVEPDQQAICPPDCIVWVSDMWPAAPLAFWSGGGRRSIPGASFPSDATSHPALTLAASLGDTIQLDGWSGRYYLGTDVARAARGDSANIENVACIWLANLYNIYGSESEKTFCFNYSSADVQWVVDWLALGDKTLIVDTPWLHTSHTYPLAAGTYDAATFANTFLGDIGSALALYSVVDATKYIESLTCVSTEQHALAPGPETLFSMTRDSGAYTLGGGVLFEPLGVTGGTAVYRIDCTMRPVLASGSFSESHPCVAVDEQGNGSRIITGSIEFTGQIYAEQDTGLATMPGIGNMIGRLIV